MITEKKSFAFSPSFRWTKVAQQGKWNNQTKYKYFLKFLWRCWSEACVTPFDFFFLLVFKNLKPDTIWLVICKNMMIQILFHVVLCKKMCVSLFLCCPVLEPSTWRDLNNSSTGFHVVFCCCVSHAIKAHLRTKRKLTNTDDNTPQNQ